MASHDTSSKDGHGDVAPVLDEITVGEKRVVIDHGMRRQALRASGLGLILLSFQALGTSFLSASHSVCTHFERFAGVYRHYLLGYWYLSALRVEWIVVCIRSCSQQGGCNRWTERYCVVAHPRTSHQIRASAIQKLTRDYMLTTSCYQVIICLRFGTHEGIQCSFQCVRVCDLTSMSSY